MEYRIEYDEIMAIVEEEVSREAGQAVTAEGVSLYDDIRMVSRDEKKKRRLMAEAMATVKGMCNRFVRHAELSEEGPESFVFELDVTPRRITGKEVSLQTLLSNLTVNLILNRYFASKNLSDIATKYDSLAASDVQSITKTLYEKLPPIYPKK